MKFTLFYGIVLIGYFLPQNAHAESNLNQLKVLADNYSNAYLNMYQPFAYFENIELSRHNKFIQNSPDSFKSYQATEDQIHIALKKFDINKIEDIKAKVFYAKFSENIEANIDKRICKSELWSVSHMFGPHMLLDRLVNVQPVKTDQDKEDAIARWGEAARYYDQEIKNLNRGLKQGYSAPKRVVNRLLINEYTYR